VKIQNTLINISMSTNNLRRRIWWKTHRGDALAIGIYAVFVLLLAAPVIISGGRTMYGEFGGDASIWMWMGWWQRKVIFNGYDFNFIHLNQYPFGTDHAFRSYWGTTTGLMLWSMVFGGKMTSAYSAMLLLPYFLSSTLTYAAARQLRATRSASFAAGLIFGFSSYALIHGRSHVDQSQIWVIPLVFLALIRFHRKRTWVAAVLLGLALGLTMHMHVYYGYFSIHMIVAFVIYEGVLCLKDTGFKGLLTPGYIPMYAAAALVSLLVYLPAALIIINDLRGVTTPLRSTDLLTRPYSWFFYLSSRPWDFFLPPTDHPVLGSLSRSAYNFVQGIGLGDFTPNWIENRYPDIGQLWFWQRAGDPNSNDRYLGYATLIAATYGVHAWWRSRRTKSEEVAKRDGWSFWMPYLLILFAIGIVFSLPPYMPIGGFLGALWEPLRAAVIPMPSWFMMEFVTPLRVVARFMLLANLSLAMIVTYGLDTLRLRHPSRYGVLFGVFIAVFAFEHIPAPLYDSAVTPEEYQWLAEQPEGTVTLSLPVGFLSKYTAYQTHHEQPIVYSIAGISSTFLLDNIGQITEYAETDLTQPSTVDTLSARGVDYVFNHEERIGDPIDGLQLVLTTDTAQVFEVTANPGRMVVLWTLKDGLWKSEADWSGDEDKYTIYVWNPLNDTVPVDISVQLSDETTSSLTAYRHLTPPPEKIVFTGLLIDNPNIPPVYPDTGIEGGLQETTIHFEDLDIQIGETILTLEWQGQNHPAIEDITFSSDALPPD